MKKEALLERTMQFCIDGCQKTRLLRQQEPMPVDTAAFRDSEGARGFYRWINAADRKTRFPAFESCAIGFSQSAYHNV